MIGQLTERYAVSEDAVRTLRRALEHGGGPLALFSHPELGGYGQWMPGMTQIGDMFNHELCSRVVRLCQELSDHFLSEGEAEPAAPARTPAGIDRQALLLAEKCVVRFILAAGGVGVFAEVFRPPACGRFIGSIGFIRDIGFLGDMGFIGFIVVLCVVVELVQRSTASSPSGATSITARASATGCRRSKTSAARIAWWAAFVTGDGTVHVYDTGDHRISGVQQHQSGGGPEVTFTSQHGEVDLATLTKA